MKKLLLPSMILLFFVSVSQAQYAIELDRWVSGISIPTAIAHAGDERLFINEKGGRVRIITPDGQLLPEPFLDIRDRVRSTGGEQGLLGLAFHPGFATNRAFFVHYTRNDGATVVSRFLSEINDPDRADPGSETVLLVIPQPFANHNGGDLHFGPDGYLYISTGDGGSGGDPQDNGQDRMTLLGKILRIDVDAGPTYGIPAGNPFVGDPATLDEIWALGLRNPWRFSFDRESGDMWIGDVGQGAWEEIDREPAGSSGGLNYGWRCYEGLVPFNLNGCGPKENYTFPVHVYPNSRFGSGCSVTGGYVYRGSRYPVMYGDYLYTDFCSGKFWVLSPETDSTFSNREVGDFQANEFGALGEDVHGELYAAALSSGIIYRISVPCQLSYRIDSGDQQCPEIADGIASIEVTRQTGDVRYLWSTGDTSAVLDSLLPGWYRVTISDGSCAFMDSVKIDTSSYVPCQLFAQKVAICDGESIGLSGCPAPNGLKGQWYLDGIALPGDTGQVLTATLSGRYTYGYTGICTIPGEGYFDVELIRLDTPVIVQMDPVVVGPGGYSEYLWSINGEEISTGMDSVIEINGRDGFYSLIVIDSNGCRSPSSDTIAVMVGHTVYSPLGPYALYPNPAGDRLFLTLPSPGFSGRWAILGKGGSVLLQGALTRGQERTEIRTDALPTGTYFIRVDTDLGGFSGRFVKLE